ncbi:NHL repeat-containing protein [Anaeromyxobacter oryzae]|uniref:NHL repeat containing protein n=1 Tax=Anaeromyxobacter oryzae TaxID=2918170 RepID=A0ABM7X0F1_9BACT|nr:hypothetical protein [Anaeromyxobacter oryzae]BDG05266.1 hypothetical protein AMOR_42620 [Anaeromyxobacter oryzae]
MSSSTKLLALAAAVLGPVLARAESVVFTYTDAVYIDSKEAPLRSPEGVACNDGGTLIVADTGNSRLVPYTVKDDGVTAGAEIKLSQVVAPVRVQLDPKGGMVVLDRKGSRLVRLDAKGAYAGVIEPKGDLPGTFAPVSFKLDADQNVWVLDGAGRIVVLDPAGKVTRTLDLPKGGMFTDLAVDGGGMLYAVDAVQGMVWSADKAATALKPLSKSLKDEMSFPGFLLAAKGKLLLVDQVGHGVVVLGTDGSFQGRQLSYGAAEGLLQYPGQICLTERGDAFVADRNNNRVDRYTTAR